MYRWRAGDATPFTDLQVNSVALSALTRISKTRVHNGHTGEYMDAKIFVGLILSKIKTHGR